MRINSIDGCNGQARTCGRLRSKINFATLDAAKAMVERGVSDVEILDENGVPYDPAELPENGRPTPTSPRCYFDRCQAVPVIG
jgi:hypothetical protein